MIRLWLGLAALGGFCSVLAGAAAAHLAAGDPRPAELLRTGAFYGLVHAVAVVALAALAAHRTRLGFPLAAAGWCFLLGICLFSFNLYALALTGIRGFAIATPFGGIAFLVGWVALAGAVLRR